jgi:hypothetical protein
MDPSKEQSIWIKALPTLPNFIPSHSTSKSNLSPNLSKSKIQTLALENLHHPSIDERDSTPIHASRFSTEDLKKHTAQEITRVLNYIKANPLGTSTLIRNVVLDNKEYEVIQYSPGYKPELVTSYETRQNYLYQAALHYVNDNVIDNFQRKRSYQILEKLNKEFAKAIDAARNQKDQDLHETVFPLLKKFTSEVISKLEINVKDLIEAEKKYITKKGRPTVINTYLFEGKKYISMQAPVGEKTIPSIVRDEKGLVNHVTTSSGFIDEEDHVVILFQATRHSSLSPIAIQNPMTRIAYACSNAREKIKDHAKKIISANPHIPSSKENPLVIPMSVMMLLTPKLFDGIRNYDSNGNWKGESETMQLEESALALTMIKDRVFEIQLETEDNKTTTLWVKPEVSLMNLGVNLAATNKGFLGKAIPFAKIQKQINAIGFVEFEDSSLNYIEKRIKDIKDPNLLQIFKSYKALLEPTNPDNSKEQKLKIKIDNLQEKIEHKKAKLRYLYENLEMSLWEYESLDGVESKKERTILAKKISLQRKKIKEEEIPLYHAYEKLQSIKTHNFLKKETILKAAVDSLLKAINSISNQNNSYTMAAVKELNAYLTDFQTAQNIYYHRQYRNKDRVMDFQTIYLKLEEVRGNFVTFFCKSAEDRTGRVDDRIQEREILNRELGPFPNPTEVSELNSRVAPVVHRYSASQNNTEYNSGARGLQISPKLNKDFAEEARLEKKSAKTAKGIYNAVKKTRIDKIIGYCKKILRLIVARDYKIQE